MIRKDISAKNRSGMKKVYKFIEPLISAGQYEQAGDVLANAYAEYSLNRRNIRKDIDDQQWAWPFLDDAIRHYERYDPENPNSNQSINFKRSVVENIKSAAAPR
jgi:hypothetical protein